SVGRSLSRSLPISAASRASAVGLEAQLQTAMARQNTKLLRQIIFPPPTGRLSSTAGVGLAIPYKRASTIRARPALHFSEVTPTITHQDLMLATVASKPFDRPGWIFELKYDGVRAGDPREDGRASDEPAWQRPVRLLPRNSRLSAPTAEPRARRRVGGAR